MRRRECSAAAASPPPGQRRPPPGGGAGGWAAAGDAARLRAAREAGCGGRRAVGGRSPGCLRKTTRLVVPLVPRRLLPPRALRRQRAGDLDGHGCCGRASAARGQGGDAGPQKMPGDSLSRPVWGATAAEGATTGSCPGQQRVWAPPGRRGGRRDGGSPGFASSFQEPGRRGEATATPHTTAASEPSDASQLLTGAARVSHPPPPGALPPLARLSAPPPLRRPSPTAAAAPGAMPGGPGP